MVARYRGGIVMAKRGRKPGRPKSNGAAEGSNGAAGEGVQGQSTMGYFRKLFLANRKLLRTRSNAELLGRWLADHPGEETVPNSVKQSLSNVKSTLRKKYLRGPRASKISAEVEEQAGSPETAVASSPLESALEALEVQIDDCLTLARNIDREGLHEVISYLRRARNQVVWKMG
jgi:hypothetical protein